MSEYTDTLFPIKSCIVFYYQAMCEANVDNQFILYNAVQFITCTGCALEHPSTFLHFPLI